MKTNLVILIARAEEEMSTTPSKITNQMFVQPSSSSDGPESLNAATFVSVVSFYDFFLFLSNFYAICKL